MSENRCPACDGEKIVFLPSAIEIIGHGIAHVDVAVKCVTCEGTGRHREEKDG